MATMAGFVLPADACGVIAAFLDGRAALAVRAVSRTFDDGVIRAIERGDVARVRLRSTIRRLLAHVRRVEHGEDCLEGCMAAVSALDIAVHHRSILLLANRRSAFRLLHALVRSGQAHCFPWAVRMLGSLYIAADGGLQGLGCPHESCLTHAVQNLRGERCALAIEALTDAFAFGENDPLSGRGLGHRTANGCMSAFIRAYRMATARLDRVAQRALIQRVLVPSRVWTAAGGCPSRVWHALESGGSVAGVISRELFKGESLQQRAAKELGTGAWRAKQAFQLWLLAVFHQVDIGAAGCAAAWPRQHGGLLDVPELPQVRLDRDTGCVEIELPEQTAQSVPLPSDEAVLAILTSRAATANGQRAISVPKAAVLPLLRLAQVNVTTDDPLLD